MKMNTDKKDYQAFISDPYYPCLSVANFVRG